MNTDRKEIQKMIFKKKKKILKTMEILSKQKDIKLGKTERRRKYLVPEQNYHTKKFFTVHPLVIEMKEHKYL